MTIPWLASDTLTGKIARWPLRLIPAGMVVPILRGRLRGRKWIVGASNHGYWLGTYELETRRRFEKSVPSGATVYDLGAHVGYYTLLASVTAGPLGRVFAFEPLPRNLKFLREHLRLNDAANVTVMEAAVSDTGGTATFEEDASISRGRLGDSGTISVRTVGLDEAIRAGELPIPDVIKMDIEGAEYRALQGAADLLARRHPLLFLSTHGGKVHKDCCRLLTELGYRLEPLGTRDLERARELIAQKRA